MFGIFNSNPVKKLQKRYETLLTSAQEAQRNGDIRRYSELSAEAEALYEQIVKLREER